MEISQKKFNKILKKNFLFEKKPTIAVAVSGGPDSMALVFLLNKWIQNNQGKIFALIIDHGIRKESYKESKTIGKTLACTARFTFVSVKKDENGMYQKINHNQSKDVFLYCLQ